MMFCQKCVTKLVDGRCPRCNPLAEIKSPEERESYRNTPPPANFPDVDEYEFINFLKIEKMITPARIKAIYMPVSIVIVVGMLVVMFSGTVAMFFLGLINGVIFIILFRIACEILLSLSSIHKKLDEAESKTETKSSN